MNPTLNSLYGMYNYITNPYTLYIHRCCIYHYNNVVIILLRVAMYYELYSFIHFFKTDAKNKNMSYDKYYSSQNWITTFLTAIGVSCIILS